MAGSLLSISRILVRLSSKLPPTCRRWVRQGTAQRGPHCSCDPAPWFSKCGTCPERYQHHLRLTGSENLGSPSCRPTKSETVGRRAQQSVFTSFSGYCDVHRTLRTTAPRHPSSIPKRRWWWEPTNGRVPSAYRLADSRCQHNEEFGGLQAGGVGGEAWLWKGRFRAS